MTKDIDTTGAFGTSANCLPAPGVSVGIQPVGTASVSAGLDLDLSQGLDLDLSDGLDLDLSEGPGYVDSGIKDAGSEPFNPATDRVTFQAQGLDLKL